MLNHSHRRGAVIAAGGLLGPALTLALAGCGQDIACGDAAVQSALHRAVDQFYGEAGAIAKIEFTVKDVISVGQSERRVSCKAVAHLSIGFLGVVQAADPVIPYTAELTDGGTVIVTADLQ